MGGNLVDYLEWRGDLPLAASPLGATDLLLMSHLSYMPWDGVVSVDFDETVSLREAASRLIAEKRRLPRLPEDEQMLPLLVGSARFAGFQMTGFRDVFSAEAQEQFAAVTFLSPDGSAVAAFRGTDATLVGFKEDLNMAFSQAVPAQLDAVRYVSELAEAREGPMWLCGHSKGGNLAVYAAAFSPECVQARLCGVANFDGPGFNETVIASDAFGRVDDRVRTYLPQSSIVGMLLEHAEDFTIVESSAVSLRQHNPYTWRIVRDGFSTLEARTNSSRFVDATLKAWVARMEPELRAKMIDGVYAVLSASDGRSVRDLASGRSALAIFKAAEGMDAPTRAAVAEAFRLLGRAAKGALPELFEQMKGDRQRQ